MIHAVPIEDFEICDNGHHRPLTQADIDRFPKQEAPPSHT